MATPLDSTISHSSSRWSGLLTRVFGVLPLLAVAGFCLIKGGWFFYAFIMTAAILMLREWDTLTKDQGAFLQFLGYPVVIIPCASIIWINTLSSDVVPNFGFKLVITLIVIIAATDMGAYFTGKRFGKHKLAPSISPNKTWEGLSGGMFCAMAVAAVMIPFPMPVYSMLSAGLMLALLGQTGDLFESWVKRRAGVKDSGKLIPGHGGLLDRFDGYLFAAPAFALLVYAKTPF